MEDLFKPHYNNISCSNDVTTGVENYRISRQLDHNLFGSETAVSGSEIMSSEFIKAQITNHPLYPTLVSTYINCRKVGASPETASFLEEISRESVLIGGGCDGNYVIGVDSELDDFMESYCEILQGYKEELLKPLAEAATFVSDIQSQLSSMISQEAAPMTATTATATSLTSDEAAGTSEEEVSCKELEAAESHSGVSTGYPELKETLLRKYSGYLSGLKTDFLKKRKNGKLPKDARNSMLDWWNNHYRWPYPTEEEKAELSEITGLDQKQINNWFINQRKRHWRPSEDMRFALMEGVRDDNIGGSVYIDTAGATGTVDVSNAN